MPVATMVPITIFVASLMRAPSNRRHITVSIRATGARPWVSHVTVDQSAPIPDSRATAFHRPEENRTQFTAARV